MGLKTGVVIQRNPTTADRLNPLIDIGAKIIELSPKWSTSQAVSINGGADAVVILNHDSGAQLALCISSTTGVAHADNCSGAYTTYPQDLRVALNPSTPVGTWATVDDTVNPRDTSTWCADAQSFKFCWIGQSGDDDDTGYILYVTVDEDYANVIFLKRHPSITWSPMHRLYIAADGELGAPNFIETADPDDLYKSWCLQWNVADNYHIFGPYTESNVKGQFFSDGVLQDQIACLAMTSGETLRVSLDAAYLRSDEFVHLRTLAMSTRGSSTAADNRHWKGVLHPELISIGNSCLAINALLAEDLLHVDNGCVVGWETAFGQPGW